jgi:peroxiredoxin
MNRIVPAFLLAIVIASPSFAQNKKSGFEIFGTVAGFKDSTLIFLGDNDSAFLINNQFHFAGSLKEEARKVLIRTANFKDYKFFWLENSVILFKADKGRFREAVITGSNTQNEQNELDISIKNTGKKKEQDIFFISKHPNSMVSANLLSIYASSWGKDTVTTLYNELSDRVKNTADGKDIREFIALNKNIKVGDKYVDFTEPDMQGKNVRLSDFKGKIILLEFWGALCAPCRKANPEMVKIYNEFKNQGFDIIAVSIDDNKIRWLDAIKLDGLTWHNLSDLKGDKTKAALIYGVSYIPTNFLIDRDGTIIAKDLPGNDLRNRLLEMLKN